MSADSLGTNDCEIVGFVSKCEKDVFVGESVWDLGLSLGVPCDDKKVMQVHRKYLLA